METLQYSTQSLLLVAAVAEMKDQMAQEDLADLEAVEGHHLLLDLVAQQVAILEEHLDLLHLQMGGVTLVVQMLLLHLMVEAVAVVLEL